MVLTSIQGNFDFHIIEPNIERSFDLLDITFDHIRHLKHSDSHF